MSALARSDASRLNRTMKVTRVSLVDDVSENGNAGPAKCNALFTASLARLPVLFHHRDVPDPHIAFVELEAHLTIGPTVLYPRPNVAERGLFCSATGLIWRAKRCNHILLGRILG